VLVEDPSQLSRDAKVQEAERERRFLNNRGSAGTASLQQEQESVGGSDNPIAPTPGPESQSQSQSYFQRISTFAHPVDAPPAYSPSPTSPTTVNNYQTFTSTATMGRPEETQPLITHSHVPQSMSNPPPNPSQDQPSRWQKFKGFVARLNIRRRIKTFLASLLIFTVVFMIFSSFTMSSSHGVSTPVNPTPLIYEFANFLYSHIHPQSGTMIPSLHLPATTMNLYGVLPNHALKNHLPFQKRFRN